MREFFTSPRSFAGRDRIASPDAIRVRGEAVNLQDLRTWSVVPTRESGVRVQRSASPLTRSLRLRSGFDLSPQKSGERVRVHLDTCAETASHRPFCFAQQSV